MFTPEEGGSFVGERFSFVAKPGDVPNALIVGVNMIERGEASNMGMTRHRYTFGGNYHAIDSVNEHGYAHIAPFVFRNPGVACLPLPSDFLPNIDDVRLIATDSEGLRETVLTSSASIGVAGFQVCGYVGTIPTVLVVGREGSPAPLMPTPTPVVEDADLPVTGGLVPNETGLVLFFVLGITIVVVGCSVSKATRRRDT